MNGFYSSIFIILLMFILIAVDYIYSISDKIVDGIYANIVKNQYTDLGFQFYADTRAIFYGGITGVLVPFFIFLSFVSSFLNRNQDIAMYLISNLAIIIFTPMSIYLFSNIFTQMFNVTILDTAYMATIYFQNFIYIMIANMLLSLASFVFIAKRNTGIYGY